MRAELAVDVSLLVKAIPGDVPRQSTAPLRASLRGCRKGGPGRSAPGWGGGIHFRRREVPCPT